MAHSTTPFSFHCMICFEEFHPDEKYPVVLPCGHTYVCNACADRIDVCMECREPLYTLIAKPNAGGAPMAGGTHSPTPMAQNTPQGSAYRSSWSSARSGGRPSTAHQHQAAAQTHHPSAAGKIKQRLPLPKNVVLLSLIEATELASEDARKKFTSSPRNSGDSDEYVNDHRPTGLHSMGSVLDAEDEEEEKIKIGTSLAIGVAGTYAVAARQGLEMYPSRPSTVNMDGSSGIATEEDVDTLVRFFHMDNNNNNANRLEDGNESPIGGTSGMTDTARLSFGDRVQIVTVEGGWAKVARGYGFIRADRNQLVKVGGPVDRACKIEAMLRALSLRRRELRLEQSKIDNQFIGLMNDLQISLQSDEDLTVILADAFSPPPSSNVKKDPDEEVTASSGVSDAAPALEERNDRAGSPDCQVPVKRQTSITCDSRPLSFTCFAGEVFTPTTSDNVEHRRLRALEMCRSPTMDSDPGIIVGTGGGSGQRGLVSDDTTSFFQAASHTSPSAMRAGAQAWRERNGRVAASGADAATPNGAAVDFRTGLSGHMALLSTHTRAHEYLDPQPVRASPSTFRKMSSHTGLTVPMPSFSGVMSFGRSSFRHASVSRSNTTPRASTTTNRLPVTTEVTQTGSM